MDSLKILHLANVIGEKKGGGLHEVVVNFYKYQKSLGHEPSIWYPGPHSDADSIRLDDNIRGLSTFGNSDLGLVKELFSTMNNDVEQFNIVHQHGIWMPMSLYSMKIKKQFNLKSVIQPHGYLEPFRMNISKYKKKAAYWLYENSNLRNASALIACSEDEALKLKSIFPQNEVAIILNGIDPDFFHAASAKNNSSKTKKSLLFLSQIIPLKGLDRLFNVIADIGLHHFNDWEFIVAGYGDDKYLKSLKKLATDLNLNKLVSFVGRKTGHDKLQMFDNATFFVLPTFNENYGIVVAEALARGIPVLTTKGTPWKELNSENCGLWLDNTEEGLREGLLKMLSLSDVQIKNMGLNGKDLIAKKYLWNSTTLRTIRLYKWILHGGGKPDFVL